MSYLAIARVCSLGIEFLVIRCVVSDVLYHSQGGSLGKGTMVKDLSDVDLVAFVNKPYLKPIAEIGKEEYKRALSKIISEIASTLRGVANVQNIRYDEYLVKFKIQVKSRWIDVDLLPTTENVPYQSCK